MGALSTKGDEAYFKINFHSGGVLLNAEIVSGEMSEFHSDDLPNQEKNQC